MKVNPQVQTQWIDLNGNIKIPDNQHCPTPIKAICENILTMCTRLGYHHPPYTTMSQLDKILMLQYWKYFDGMRESYDKPNDFYRWFIEKATPPEMVRRSRQFLVEVQAIWVDSNVVENAHKAGEKMSKAMANLI
jgi:hypothetical protein